MHSQRRASIAISSSPPSFLLQGVVWVLDILMCNAMYVPIHLSTKSGEMCLKESSQTKTLLILWWLVNSNFVHFGSLQNFTMLEHRFFNLIAEFNFTIRISYFHQLFMVRYSGNVEFFEAMYQETKMIQRSIFIHSLSLSLPLFLRPPIFSQASLENLIPQCEE